MSIGNEYFSHVVNRLKIHDISLIGKLYDKDATNHFKALSKKTLIEELEISEANLRKIIYRLEALDFIQAVTGDKTHKIFITELGVLALENSLQGEEVEA